jgi:predicted NAD-dependent protein-ADP-ribosyltransferase YbiA (DUF1768 family)
MVLSKIDKTVHYVENKKIDEEDRGFATSLFEIEILERTIVIGLGKEKHTYENKGIVFFPIYLVANNAIKSKIGVYEMKATDVISSLDEDGDINIEDAEPLLFSFVKPRFLDKSGSSPDFYYNQAIQKNKKEFEDKKAKEVEKKEDDKKEKEEEQKDNIRSIKQQIRSDVPIVKTDIFEIDSNKNIPDMLPEEKESDADELVKQYVKSTGHNWIKKFMENDEYEIVSNECNSVNSLFCIVRDAYLQIGHKTSVATLQTMVAKEITDEFYEKCLDKHLIYSSEITRIDKEMRDLKKTASIYKTRSEKSTNKEEHQAILKSAEELKDKYKELSIQKKLVEVHAAEYAFMKEIRSVEDLRKMNMSANEVMHDFAVRTIEKELNVKIVGLLQDAFDHGDLNAVVQCYGEDYANPKPRHYIIMAHSMKRKQCELVSYKNKRIFVFAELPYHMKTLITNKCAEREGGTFPMVSDFRNFMSKLGVSHSTDEDDDTVDTNKDILVFHAKSMNRDPSKMKGDKIADAHLLDYLNLSKEKNWRRMLDDEYEAPFKLDKMRWQTVEHYYQGAKFKKRHPDFYHMFALDSDSDISKDLTKAIEAGNKRGKGRPKNITIDPDFYGLDGGRAKEERRMALMAKFNQNEDMRRILLNTRDAVLKKRVKGEPHQVDDLLMEVRKAVQ